MCSGTKRYASAIALAISCGVAGAQSEGPAVFVANNGNLEGSVTAFAVEADGSLTFVNRVVTGSRASTTEECGGCNPVEIALSPSGRWLATSHASGSDLDQLTIYEIAGDGSLSSVGVRFVSFSGLGLAWVTDDIVVVTNSTFGGANSINLYRWDPANTTLLGLGTAPTGSFNTSLQAHPNGRWLFANDSVGDAIRVFDIDPITGAPTLIETESTGATFPIGLELSPDGSLLFAGGGISNGGDKFLGYRVESDGTLTPLKGNPFVSPGASPKDLAFARGGSFLYVQHGTDATIRGFSIDQATGIPTSTGVTFDVGSQGTLGDAAGLGGFLYVTDETTIIDGIRGVYAFSVSETDGSLTQIGTGPVETGGITPETIAVWPGIVGCPADLAGADGVLNIDDVLAFVDAFVGQDPAADFAPPAGTFNIDDVLAFLDAFANGCG